MYEYDPCDYWTDPAWMDEYAGEVWLREFIPDDDDLMEQLDNEVVEDDETEYGAWLNDGERPVSNEES